MKTYLLHIDICYSKTTNLHPSNCYAEAQSEIKCILNKYSFRQISGSIYASEIPDSPAMEIISGTLAVREMHDHLLWFEKSVNHIYFQDMQTFYKTDAICIVDSSFLMAALEKEKKSASINLPSES